MKYATNLLYISVLLPLFRVSTGSTGSQAPKPFKCGKAEVETCTCKTFLEALQKDAFQKANKTAWDKYQALDSYTKIVEKEKSEGTCGTKPFNEKDCALTFPDFPKDDAYEKACTDIGGYLCESVVAHERCTKYKHGGNDCSRVTYERWTYPGKSTCWHRECQTYQQNLEAWYKEERNQMDKEKDLERTFTQSMDCPRKLSEEQELNMIIGISVGSVVFIAAVVAFGMWRKNYVKVHTHNETAEEMEARERELEMNGVVVGGASDAGIEEGNGKKHKHKHHHKHKKKHEHKHKHKHKHKDKN